MLSSFLFILPSFLPICFSFLTKFFISVYPSLLSSSLFTLPYCLHPCLSFLTVFIPVYPSLLSSSLFILHTFLHYNILHSLKVLKVDFCFKQQNLEQMFNFLGLIKNPSILFYLTDF